MTPEQAKKTIGLNEEGKLFPCPDMPNCVCSMYDEDSKHHMEAWKINQTNVREKLIAILDALTEARIVESSENYIRAEFTSKLFKFVDDVEFLIDSQNSLLHFRSASRLGYSDLGANKKRMKKLKKLLTQLATN